MTWRILLCSILLPLAWGQGSFRQFTSVDGRVIEARLLAVKGEQCQIEMRDGKKFVLPIARFSEADQGYIRGFAEGQGPGGAGGPANAGGAPAAPARPALGADPEFTFKRMEFKDKRTDHFDIRSTSRSFEPAHRQAEKVFDRLAEVVPGIVADFEKQQFAPPGGTRDPRDFGSEDNRFRYRVYFVNSPKEWTDAVEEYAATFNSPRARAEFTTLTPRTGNFVDLNNRFLIIWIQPGRPPETYGSLYVHMQAANLVAGQARRRSLPLWINAGVGYWMEHDIHGTCRVHYLDFEQFYEEAGGVNESEILDSNRSWTKPLRILCKKGVRHGLAAVMGAEPGNLSPELSGYVFALTSFMLSDPRKQKQYQAMLRAMRDDPDIEPSIEQVIAHFGYATVDAFEKDWYDYMKSARFR